MYMYVFHVFWDFYFLSFLKETNSSVISAIVAIDFIIMPNLFFPSGWWLYHTSSLGLSKGRK
jgi:hypothetical protein